MMPACTRLALNKGKEMKKHYAERDLLEMDRAGNFYGNHVMAMTAEQLHSKSDIAAELGWRDMQIDALQQKLDAVVAESAGMDQFVDSLLLVAWQGGSADGADIQELALKHGLIRQEAYCADSHENLVEDPGNFEEGDDVYFRVKTPATDTILNAVRAEGVELFGDSDFCPEEMSSAINEFAAQLRAAAPKGDSDEVKP